MKRKNSGYRAMAFPERLVRAAEDHSSNLFRFPSASKKRGVRAKKIFVFRQISSLPSSNAARSKQIQRIVIFDDHPASLHLVFGLRANPQVDLSAWQRVSSWVIILACVLIMGALIGMFWPIF